jgi:hypothetical protein
MPVHYVAMNDRCATLDGGTGGIAQMGKIRR